MMTVDLTGKVAIITGAGRGIGRAASVKMAKSGAKIVLVGYGEKSIAEAKEEIEAITPDVIAVQADVSKWEDVQRMVDAAVSRFGRIDILVNNAGVEVSDRQGAHTLIADIDDSDYDRIINTNLKGHFHCIKAVAPYMKNQKSGKIVNISSTTGKTGIFGTAPYVASKAGIFAQTMNTALELGPYNICVNCVAPGMILTGMHDNTPQEVIDKQAQWLPLRRVGVPDDVAHVILFFVTDELYITGQTLIVDGGGRMY